MTDEKITLVGAGLTGSLLSIYLARHGYSVEIFERRPDMRSSQISAGRSINLALSARGLHALSEVDLIEQIEPLLIQMKGRMIHTLTGETSLQPYGKNDSEVINSVSRATLNIALMNAAEATGQVSIHFNSRVTDYNFDTSTLQVFLEKESKEKQIKTDVLIGTDGSASAIREAFASRPDFTLSSDRLNYSYKELSIPPTDTQGFRLEKNALHIWPRTTFMMIALPNMDGSFTNTLFLQTKGTETSFDRLTTQEAVYKFFRTYFPDALPLMPTLQKDFFGNPTGHMDTIRCFPWHHESNVLLMGDAAHAIVPFFGQGMNCSFEDCSLLNQLIHEKKGNWGEIFSAFDQNRKENTDAIADMALENFIEMRDKVADPHFQAKKILEKILEGRHPNHFIPKYSMVSFHRFPYAVAKRRGEIQDQIMNELLSESSSLDAIHFEKADDLIKTRLPIN